MSMIGGLRWGEGGRELGRKESWEEEEGGMGEGSKSACAKVEHPEQ